ncbi:glycosyltransferase [Sphingosinicella rhizophila]|uniref:Glycosyltransferase n=1 Tax=Sphingosinicella rhizophila TaxID=3050082 RepID=A0ABU3QAP5_9SPHN|nr:glycosyltransferase [Sphingosinicella sp. GR2756]MDT9600472.1 glycosyltransferase [Sphingosinicella sp. GR2756]
MPHASPSDLPDKPEAEQRAFFDAVRGQAIRAEAATGVWEQDLAVAGAVVRLVFAGARLREALLPALAHLCVPRHNAPDIVFRIWESEESGLALPPCPCPTMCFTDRADIWTMLSARVRSAFNWGEHSLSLFDVEGKEGIFWVRSARQMPFWTIASPLRTLFSWWIETRGGQLLHAAAIGNEVGGLLVTGKGGVGKSTTALAALKAGLRYVADDYLIVTLDPEPTAHNLYCTAKVEAADAGRFADLAPQFLPSLAGVDPKGVIFLHDRMPEALAPALPLAAILTPAFAASQDTSVERAPPHLLKDAAAFTTMCQLPHAGDYTLRFVDRLVAALPGYRLLLGKDVERVPLTLRALLQAPHAPAPPATAVETPDHPLVSVVIPVHNGAHFVAEAVGSILAQGHPQLEIIIVDDGSTDAIVEAVAALPIPVELIRQPAKGPAAARNRGIAAASGDFIAFLDVDDLWPADKIAASLYAFRADPALDVVTGHGQLLRFCADPDRWEYVDNPEKNFPYYIGAAIFRRSAFARIGLFDDKLRFAEDTDWFARASEAGIAVKKLDRVSLLVRRHGGNMTAGRLSTEMVPLRFVKNILDRQRAAASDGSGEVAISRILP